jgi:hypothetical protein
MKSATLLCLIGGIALNATGCRTRYDVSMVNGGKFTNVSKPILNKATGYYQFKDRQGNLHQIATGRITGIEAR